MNKNNDLCARVFTIRISGDITNAILYKKVPTPANTAMAPDI